MMLFPLNFTMSMITKILSSTKVIMTFWVFVRRGIIYYKRVMSCFELRDFFDTDFVIFKDI